MKPTYDELKSATDLKILALKNKAFTQLLGLLGQYNSADDSTKQSIKAQGHVLLDGYDGEFAQMMDSLQLELTNHDYDSSVIATYHQEYENQKQLALAFMK